MYENIKLFGKAFMMCFFFCRLRGKTWGCDEVRKNGHILYDVALCFFSAMSLTVISEKGSKDLIIFLGKKYQSSPLFSKLALKDF